MRGRSQGNAGQNLTLLPYPPSFVSQLSDPLLQQLPSDQPLNRYPSPTHLPIKQRLIALRNLPSTDYVHLGVGSDEVIDLVMRITTTPSKEKILVCPPTYGMYTVTANVNDVAVVEVPLITEGGRFEVDVPAVRFPFFPFLLLLRPQARKSN